MNKPNEAMVSWNLKWHDMKDSTSKWATVRRRQIEANFST